MASSLSFICVPALLLTGTAALADDTPQVAHARVSLIAETTALTPGSQAWFGVRFQIDPEWHLYWDGLNDGGAPPTFTITAPAGFEIGATLWPAPRRAVAPGPIVDHLYDTEVVLLVPVRVPANAQPGEHAAFSLAAAWLNCNDEMCIPAQGSAELTVPIAAASTPGPHAKTFAAARSRIPKPPTALAERGVTLAWRGSTLTITAADATHFAFLPKTNGLVPTDIAADGEAKGGTLSVRFAAPESPAIARRAVGVLEITDKAGGTAWYDIDTPAPPEPSVPAPPAAAKESK